MQRAVRAEEERAAGVLLESAECDELSPELDMGGVGKELCAGRVVLHVPDIHCLIKLEPDTQRDGESAETATPEGLGAKPRSAGRRWEEETGARGLGATGVVMEMVDVGPVVLQTPDNLLLKLEPKLEPDEGDWQFVCDDRPRAESRELRVVLKRLLLCNDCNRDFTVRSKLVRHMGTAHGSTRRSRTLLFNPMSGVEYVDLVKSKWVRPSPRSYRRQQRSPTPMELEPPGSSILEYAASEFDVDFWASNTGNDTASDMSGDDEDLDTPVPILNVISRVNESSCLPDNLPGETVQRLARLDARNDAAMLWNLPIDRVNFDWQSDPSNFRGVRETFTGQAGPTFTVSEMTCPLDVFEKFFDEHLINYIVVETNRNAQRLLDSSKLSGSARLTRWSPVTAKDIWVFLGIVMMQGLSPLPVERQYWQPTTAYLSMPYFKELMSYNRFILIKKCLHFVDSDLLPKPGSCSKEERKLFEIEPIIDYLNDKFSTLYYPGQEVALDESLLKWKGRPTFAQKIATKAAAVGMKSYELCECKTGYLWRFQVCAGNRLVSDDVSMPQDDLDYATSKIVYELARPLFHNGHTIIMDNFNNSPLLSRVLKLSNTDTIGPLHIAGRKFAPDSLNRITEAEINVGEIACSQTEDICISVWRDVNLVPFISTFHPAEVGGAETYGTYKVIPKVVLDYSLAMGGVDKKDQLLSAFPMERVRNLIWYTKLFRRLVNISILNSSVLYNLKMKMSARSFREALVENILGKYRGQLSLGLPPLVTARPNTTVRGRYVSRRHFIEKGKPTARCRVCKAARTSWQCDTCGIPLCVINCFKEWHTM